MQLLFQEEYFPPHPKKEIPKCFLVGYSRNSGETDHHLLGASGSMYTFNRIDQRLQRLMEASIFIFESFAGLDHKYEHLGLAKFQLH